MDYTATKATAKRLIQKFGSSFTLKRPSNTSFSASGGAYTTATYTNYTVIAVFKMTDRSMQYAGERYYYGLLMELGDKEMIIASSATVTPDVGDLIIVDSKQFRIVNCIPLEPDGSDLLHKALIRR